jgi:hypothetical protein
MNRVIPIFPASVTAEKTISHSGRGQWGTCNRKFQLSKTTTYYFADKRQTKALSFGKAFGTGLQSLLAGDAIEVALLKSALDFDKVLAFDKDSITTNESLAHCHEAILSFYHGQLQEMKNDWEVLDIAGLYGNELGFALLYPNGTVERGFIDLVLQNKSTKEVIVLEIKTSGAMSVGTEADWQNSPQGIMYLLVLDFLLSSHGFQVNSRVLFIEYNKKHKKYTIFPFEKRLKERIEFLISCWMDVQAREFLLDQNVKLFKSGKCTTYNRNCDYFGICDLTVDLKYANVIIEPDLHKLTYAELINHLKEQLNAELRRL